MIKFAEFKRKCIKSKFYLQQQIFKVKEDTVNELVIEEEGDNSKNSWDFESSLIQNENFTKNQIIEKIVVSKAKKKRKKNKKESNYKDPCYPDMVCDYCDEKFLNRHKIVAHLRRIHLGCIDHKIRILCLFCDKPIDKLRQHVYSEHMYEENNQTCCQSCSYKGPNKLMFFRHFERLHTGFERPKRCPQYDTFINPRDLANHLNRIHYRLVCKLCGTETKQTQMEYHVKVKHEGKKGCTVCRYWYEDEVEYKKHMTKQNKSKKGRCKNMQCLRLFDSTPNFF